MLPALALLAPVLTAILLLFAGQGLLTTLVPLRASLEGFSAEAIGAIGSTYFVGMLAGSFAAPAIVARAGHIRAFALTAALAAIATLGFAILVQPWAWMILRCVVGFAVGALFTIVDSWVNDKATNANRARLLAVSNAVNFSGSAMGQQMLRLDDPRAFTLFSASAVFYMLALLPMALTRAEPPAPSPKGRVAVLTLARTSPIGFFGMLAVGLANAPFWMLAPAYVERLGLGVDTVTSFMTAMILGSALGPYPLGLLADRFDRRAVIALISGYCALIELVMATLVFGGAGLILAAFLLGIGLPTLYVLVSAHTNDRAGREGMVALASTLLFVYCLGGIAGPYLAAALMTRFGDGALFLWLAGAHAALVLFVLWRMVRRPPPDKIASAVEPPETARKPGLT